MIFDFSQPAKRQNVKARVAIKGPAKVGKTYTALQVAKGLGKNIVLADSEDDSALLYARDVADFVHYPIENFHPDNGVKLIEDAEASGADVLIIDSLSHYWDGKPDLQCCHDLHKAYVAHYGEKNSIAGWGVVKQLKWKLLRKIRQSSIHIICTVRAEEKIEMVKGDSGKIVIRKLGEQPIAMRGTEHEFDLILALDSQHVAAVSGRIPVLNQRSIVKPDAMLGRELQRWSNGETINLENLEMVSQ